MLKNPAVSLLIVVRDEKEYIEKSLNSLLSQTYPKNLTEILLIDGMSTDGTREWLQDKVEELKNKRVNIKLFDNPGKILATGWNIGIRNASGDIVCRIDAHSEICSDYVEKGVKTLLEMKNEKVICVGGILEHIGDGIRGEAIANLLSSSFAVGNSPFRTDSNFRPKFSSPKFTDTAVYGLYWEKVFEEIGYFDELTKLPKRKIMRRIMEICLGQFQRQHIADFSFLMIDIDHFKKINDTWGHQAGDQVLAELAELMSASKRREDEIGRYGGEEFYAVCIGSRASGIDFARRLRRVIEEHDFRYKGEKIGLTVSVGIAAASELKEQKISELVSLADQRLYQAKKRGRNQVVGGEQ